MEPGQTAASTIPEVFYDVLSILMPGLYLLIALYFIESEIISTLVINALVHPALTVLVLAYLLGFFLYSIGSLLVAKPFNRLLGQPAHFLILHDPDGHSDKYLARHQRLFMGIPSAPTVLCRVVERGLQGLTGDREFRVTRDNVNETYELCRNHVMEHSLRRAVAIRKEQAYGEMSRAIIVISVFLLLALCLGRWGIGHHIEWFWPQVGMHFVFLVTFSFRYAQARIIGPYYIYATFSMMISATARATAH